MTIDTVNFYLITHHCLLWVLIVYFHGVCVCCNVHSDIASVSHQSTSFSSCQDDTSQCSTTVIPALNRSTFFSTLQLNIHIHIHIYMFLHFHIKFCFYKMTTKVILNIFQNNYNTRCGVFILVWFLTNCFRKLKVNNEKIQTCLY